MGDLRLKGELGLAQTAFIEVAGQSHVAYLAGTANRVKWPEARTLPVPLGPVRAISAIIAGSKIMDLALEVTDVPGLKNRFKELRELRGLTLEQLEEKSGVSASTISRLENGGMKITAEYISLLAEALDFHPAEFIADLGDVARTERERSILDLLRSLDPAAADAWIAAGRHLPKQG